jgi:hypothetical protein
MSKFRVPRPLVGAMEAAAVCIRRCSNVLPPNMVLVSLFNHDTISVNLLLCLNILLALCYLACEAHRYAAQGHIPPGRVSHGRLPHGHAPHGHASQRHIPHGRVSHGRLPHGHAPHGHVSQRHAKPGASTDDTPGAVFGAKSSAKSVTDPWGAMNSKGGCDD